MIVLRIKEGTLYQQYGVISGSDMMDPRDYDRIADLLMQIRRKIAHNLKPVTHHGKHKQEIYLQMIESMLQHTDQLANDDQKGLL